MLVDVGGGEGALLAAILAANTARRGILFDQLHLVAAAGDLPERAGVADRCKVIGESFFDAVLGGADVYLLKSIVDGRHDAGAIEILHTCRAAVVDNLKLLLVEFVVEPGNGPEARPG